MYLSRISFLRGLAIACDAAGPDGRLIDAELLRDALMSVFTSNAIHDAIAKASTYTEFAAALPEIKIGGER